MSSTLQLNFAHRTAAVFSSAFAKWGKHLGTPTRKTHLHTQDGVGLHAQVLHMPRAHSISSPTGNYIGPQDDRVEVSYIIDAHSPQISIPSPFHHEEGGRGTAHSPFPPNVARIQQAPLPNNKECERRSQLLPPPYPPPPVEPSDDWEPEPDWNEPAARKEYTKNKLNTKLVKAMAPPLGPQAVKLENISPQKLVVFKGSQGVRKTLTSFLDSYRIFSCRARHN